MKVGALISGWMYLRITDGEQVVWYGCDEIYSDPLPQFVGLYRAALRGEGGRVAVSFHGELVVEVSDVADGSATLTVHTESAMDDGFTMSERASTERITSMLAALFDEVLAHMGFPNDYPFFFWHDESPAGRAIADEVERDIDADIAALPDDLSYEEKEARADEIENRHNRRIPLSEEGRRLAELYRAMLVRREVPPELAGSSPE